MKLPDGLAKRYTKMSDEMGGDQAAAMLMKAGMAKRGGSSVVKMPDAEATKSILRPGVIDWDDARGVSFNIKKSDGGKIGTTGLNLDALLQSKYVQQDIKQGRDVREFTSPKAAPAVEKAEAKAVAKVTTKTVAEAKATVKAAAKVEAKATALAAKAKASKEKALEGLGYYLGLGDDHAAKEAAVAVIENDGKMKKLLCCVGCITLGAVIGWFAHQKLA